MAQARRITRGANLTTHIPEFVSNPRPSIYLEEGWLCLDVETSNIECGSALNSDNRLVLASWYTEAGGMQTRIGGELEQKELLEAVRRCKFLIAHNAKFELQWLDRCGLDCSKILVYDTMLGEWVVAGNRQWAKDLNSTAQRYEVGEKEDSVARLIKAGVNPVNIPYAWLARYCEQDVRITTAVFLKQRQLLSQREQLHLQYSRCLLTPVLANIEKNGVSLDKQAVTDEYKAVSIAYENATQLLNELAGECGVIGIKWRSPKQVGELLYDKLGFEELRGRDRAPLRTDAGGRCTDSATISQLKARTKQQKDFIRAYSEAAKLSAKLTKTLNFFRAVVDEHDGTFYGIFNQGITQTHRLSSSGRKVRSSDGKTYSAQLQNIPREYKKLIVAKEKGWTVVEIDGSGLEFRVATDLGHDEVAYKEIVEGADVHQVTADTMAAAGEPMSRQQAKPYTFRPLYGGSSGTPAVQAYCKFFQEKYNAIFKEQTSWTETVLRDKELRTPYGMIFYWPDTRMTRSGFITNTTNIFNYPVQGLATAEIIPVALVHAWHKLREFNVRFILTIHDSIVLEVGPDVDKEELYRILFECFTTDVYRFMNSCYNYKVWVTLGAEIKEGVYWGDGKGLKYSVSPTIDSL